MLKTIGTLVNGVPPYLRYVAVSGGALGIDLGLYLIALAAGISAPLAAAFGQVDEELETLVVNDEPQGLGVAPPKARQVSVVQLDQGIHHTDLTRPTVPFWTTGPQAAAVISGVVTLGVTFATLAALTSTWLIAGMGPASMGSAT